MNIVMSIAIAAIVILPTNNQWVEFQLELEQRTATFDLDGPAVIEVTDCGYPGSKFAVYDGTVLLGETPTVTGATYEERDFDACFASPDFSSGTFVVGAGFHVITVEGITIAQLVDIEPSGIRARPATVAPTLPIWAAVGFFVSLIGAGAFALRRIV